MALEQIPIPYKYNLRRVPITHQLLTCIHLLCHLADNTPKNNRTYSKSKLYLHSPRSEPTSNKIRNEQTPYNLLYKTKSEKDSQTKKKSSTS